MNRDDLLCLLDEYAAWIDAELRLLQQLAETAKVQRAASTANDLAALGAAAGTRDEIMRSLVTIEGGLRGVRQTLDEHRQTASTLDGYDEVAARHREATHLVSLILSMDRESMSALADAELARRSAVASLERDEAALAGYRRVLAPPVASAATLVDRRG
jgi:hypothetical protein